MCPKSMKSKIFFTVVILFCSILGIATFKLSTISNAQDPQIVFKNNQEDQQAKAQFLKLF